MAFSETGAAQRAVFLERIAEELGKDAATVVATAAEETGLTLPRLEGELARTRNQLLFHAQLVREGSFVDARIEHADPSRTPLPKPDLRSMLVPIGPVAVFGASNFPLAFSTAGGDTASALAAGCPVVVKAHPLHPGTSLRAAAAIERARHACGLPAGIFEHLLSGGDRSIAVGIELVQDPRIQAVGFTGSLRGGKALLDAISQRETPIPLFAELGALNPVFVLPHALQERAATLAAQLFASISGSCGQLCTRPGLIFLHDGAGAQQFTAELVRLAAAAAPQVMLSPDHRSALARAWQERKSLPGVQHLHADAPDPAAAGVVIESCTLSTFLETPALSEECFGPSTLLVTCRDAQELELAARATSGSLTATVFRAAQDEVLARQLLKLLQPHAGRLIVDGVPTGVEVNSAMQHGGPWPSSSRPDTTSVGGRAMRRWLRPMCYQNWPDAWLPPALQEANPLGLRRLVDGKY